MNCVKFDDHKVRKIMAYVFVGDVSGVMYLANNLRTWAKYEMTQDPIDVMTSTISHESLHVAIAKVDGERASIKLDKLFGNGHEHKEEYHGLCKFDKRFKPTPKRFKIKGWNRR